MLDLDSGLIKCGDIYIETKLKPTRKEIKIMEKLNTKIAQKVYKYCITLPREQKLKDIEDFRVKEFKGGYIEFGKELGIELGKELEIEDKKQIDELKQIIYIFGHYEIFFNFFLWKNPYVIKGKLLNIMCSSDSISKGDELTLTILPTAYHSNSEKKWSKWSDF